MSETHDYSQFQDPKEKDSVLGKISELALEQKKLEASVARMQEDLKKEQDKLKDVSEFRLPQLMDSIGMASFTLADGSKIEVKETIRASIPEAKQGEAFQWLDDNKQSGLIKREFIINFGRDEEEWAKEFEEELRKKNTPINYKTKRSVHNSTLVSFVKQQLEEGVNLPLDLFGVFRQRSTKITE